MREIEINETLDRDKILDEAIFMALCGRDLCKSNSCITGIVRLEMAHHKLGRVIAKIRHNQEEKWKNSIKTKETK